MAMFLKNRFFTDKSGGVMILVALMTPLLLTITGVVVDLGKMYAVQSRAQGALDAALLGAVSTAASTNVTTETRALFSANFPSGYMGTTNTQPSVTSAGTVYTATARVTVPWSIMGMFGFSPLNLDLRAQVSRAVGGTDIELALVVDNSDAFNVNQLRSPTQDFVDGLFGGAATQPGVYVSVVPFDVAVNVQTTPITRQTWPQNLVTFLLLGGGGTNGFLANRNPDMPVDANYNDVSDTPPGIPLTERFRTPYGMEPGTFNNRDFVASGRPLRPMLFASNTRATVRSSLGNMRRAGHTRINVGLMWGWHTLSPRWAGRWDPGRPGMPQAASPTRQKVMILIVGSQNDVYLGGTQPCGLGVCAVPNDNTTSAQLCAAIKGQGITLYTVGYGSATNYNAALLSACANDASHYFTATNPATLRTALNSILDKLQYDTLRLSQ